MYEVVFIRNYVAMVFVRNYCDFGHSLNGVCVCVFFFFFFFGGFF